MKKSIYHASSPLPRFLICTLAATSPGIFSPTFSMTRAAEAPSGLISPPIRVSPGAEALPDVSAELLPGASSALPVAPVQAAVGTALPRPEIGDAPISFAGGTDNARVTVSTLPTSLSCRSTIEASITMRNTGTTVWTKAAGYKLGTVDDSDPFYSSTRVYLPDNLSVRPGGSYTFTFVLEAAGPGAFITDWRMVHEGVGWFGATVSKSVAVSCVQEICPGVTADLGGLVPATAALQQCVDATPSGGTLELPPGTYLMNGQLLLDQPITLRTAGSEGSTLGCEAAGVSCAVLSASPDLYQMGGIVRTVNTAGVKLDHLVIDGNRTARLASQAATDCKNGSTRFGYNIQMASCQSCQFTYSVSRNTLCGSSLEWTGDDATLIGNVFRSNGQNSENMMWADGLTLLHSDRAQVTDNLFVDNSDVAFVCGGARDSRLSHNTIQQDTQVAFAGLMLDNFNDSQSGDFTGAMVENNVVSCGAQNCHFGINLGPHPWYVSNNIKGGTVRYNTVTGARQGMNIDGATGGMVYANQITGSPAQADFLCGRRSTSNFNINSADSSVNLNGDSTPFTTWAWHSCP